MSFTKAELFDGVHETEKTLRELKKQAAKAINESWLFPDGRRGVLIDRGDAPTRFKSQRKL